MLGQNLFLKKKVLFGLSSLLPFRGNLHKKNCCVTYRTYGNVTYRTLCDFERCLSSLTAHFSPQIPKMWVISYFKFASCLFCCPKSLMQLFYEILHEKNTLWRTVHKNVTYRTLKCHIPYPDEFWKWFKPL